MDVSLTSTGASTSTSSTQSRDIVSAASALSNPIEYKYYKLARSAKGMNERELKPKIEERREIAVSINHYESCGLPILPAP